MGRFELAHGSTLFLDEIGELPLELQGKLLRLLQAGEFERLGSSKTLKGDVRIIAATNRVLEEEVKKGRFREDLWYRLNVFPITVPPLRKRQEDIPLLAHFFMARFAKKLGKDISKDFSEGDGGPAGLFLAGQYQGIGKCHREGGYSYPGSPLQLAEKIDASDPETVASPTMSLAEMEKEYHPANSP